jgi:predicted secreted protein
LRRLLVSVNIISFNELEYLVKIRSLPRTLTTAAALAFAATLTFPALSQNIMPTPTPQPKDVLSLDATVFTEVIPDLAFVTLAAEATGVDAGPITREVQQIINAALAQAKAVKDAAHPIEARTGAFQTTQRWNNKGVRDGWTVRAELIVKSKDFATLGTLAGKLAQQKLMIVGTGFEMSRELREREEAALIERGIAAFRAKATTASKAFGFGNFSLREVNLGGIGGQVSVQAPKMMAMRAQGAEVAPESMAIEGGKTTLTLSVSGSIVMSK